MTDYFIAVQAGNRVEYSAYTCHTEEAAIKRAQQRAQTAGGTIVTFKTFKAHSEQVPPAGLTNIMGIVVL
jgi:hypothetical protein